MLGQQAKFFRSTRLWIGIEVKSGAARKTGSMAAFQKQVKPGRTLLVGESGIPWQEFLEMNPVQLF